MSERRIWPRMDNRSDPSQGTQVVDTAEPSQRPIIGYAIDEDLVIRRVFTDTGCVPNVPGVIKGVAKAVVGTSLTPTTLCDTEFYLTAAYNSDAVATDTLYITNEDGDILYAITINPSAWATFDFPFPFPRDTEAYWVTGGAGRKVSYIPVGRRSYTV